MPDTSIDNKRIAKNTLLLYVRMLLIMAVSLYTSRVVLNTLGVVDYGIYNVVGSVLTMFTFINSAMITSTQRYITFELGKGDNERLKVVFTTCVQIHFLLAVIIVFLAETVGLWFLYEKMIIPPDRFNAAFYVYQLSILTMAIQVISVPYNSDIIAHEQMGIFAAISLVEVILKLLIVYLLVICSFDKLILYAILVALVQFFIRILFTRYCKKHYNETALVKTFDKKLAREMGKFMGWNIWGNFAAMLFGTGLNLLLNVFFGPVVNAARAVAVQVDNTLVSFSSNFMMAVNPQITKLYAQNNFKELQILLFRATKFTFFLLFLLSLPVMLETDIILRIWLKQVPDYTIVFLRLLLCIAIIDAMARPLMTAAAATGKVKLYQSLIGGILLSIVPISYVTLLLGGSPSSVYIVHLSICIVAFITRLIIVRSMIKISLQKYFIIILRCLGVVVTSLLPCLYIKSLLPDNSISTMFFICLESIVLVLISSYTIGLTPDERFHVNKKIASSVTHFIRN